VEPSSPSLRGDYVYPPLDRVTFGAGSVTALAPSLADASVERVLLLTSGTLARQTDLVERVEALVGERRAGTFSAPRAHVPRETVFAVARQARDVFADAIVTFGGGSVSDLGKAVALVLAEGLTDEAELDRFKITVGGGRVTAPAMSAPALPHWSIPTTLSAGELTAGVGVSDPSRGVKDVFGDRRLGIGHVIFDSELTLPTPRELWLSTGIRAVDHSVESWCSGVFQPFALALHRDALERLVRYLPVTAADPDDLDARTHCQIAAWEAGYGIANMRLGVSHGIGHQLGARFGVAHGITSCVVLPAAMEYNLEVAGGPLAEIAGILGAVGAEQAPDALRHFIAGLGLPTRLSDIGITKDDFDRIASASLLDVSLLGNPRPVTTVAEVIEVLEAAL
jgi:alcohol dehydrogenase class IV